MDDGRHAPSRNVIPALVSGDAAAAEAFTNYMNEVDVGAVIGRFNILGMVSDMLFLQYAGKTRATSFAAPTPSSTPCSPCPIRRATPQGLSFPGSSISRTRRWNATG